MIVRDESQQTPFYSSLIGPYDEDSHLVLSCEVEAGRPEAGNVTWWQLESISPPPPPAGGQLKPRGSKHQSALFEKATYVTTVSIDAAATSSSSDWFLGAHVTQRDALATVLPDSLARHMPRNGDDAVDGRVRYWKLVQNQTTSTTRDNKLQTTIELDRLERAHLGQEFLCLATNNDFSAPVNTSVKLNMNRKFIFSPLAAAHFIPLLAN